ncbi:Cohesin [Salix suchowensis]|nr:Cohesin [Salix suchowensis]
MQQLARLILPRSRRTRKSRTTIPYLVCAAFMLKLSIDLCHRCYYEPIGSTAVHAEDLLQTLTETPGAAQAELVNLILRACGCNDSVDADEALDYDGVVDALDNFTELLKQDNSPVYPLTSKLPIFKKFRKSLSEFLGRLISSSASLGHLYTTDLMPTLQTWVIAMSSSQIRSFRHTATVVALEVETALCEVAAKVEKEAEVIGRQREARRSEKPIIKYRAKDKQLEGKAAEVRERRTKVAEYLKEFVDGVFVHRYRDLDPNIRAECVHAIGLWFKKFPAHYLDGSYLRYVGWVLSDSTTQVRLEAVRALIGVYEQTDYIGSLNHFTERFKPRLVEMATSDTELSVRVAVIQVLESMDDNSLLEDEERQKLCLLIYDQEPKIRRAVSALSRVCGMRRGGTSGGRSNSSTNDKARAGVKALAMLLVKWAA